MRRVLSAGLFLLATLLLIPARASVSIAVTWDGLLRESTLAVLGTAGESHGVWENGRIYTYTRVRFDRGVAGAAASGSDGWVRTMGGVVDQIGQLVEGEATFAPGRSSLLFLHPGPAGTYEVTARAQGQFPVQNDDPKQPPRLIRGSGLGALVLRNQATASPRLAADVVHGRLVDDVVRDVVADWDRTHAR
jgi:hypothetical protein